MNDPIRLFYSPTINDKGIIGANPGNQFDISGVAYDSSLSAYRVFGCTGSVTDDSKSLYLAHTYKIHLFLLSRRRSSLHRWPRYLDPLVGRCGRMNGLSHQVVYWRAGSLRLGRSSLSLERTCVSSL